LLTAGTLGAITAFKNGDPINGSAQVMNIAASLAPLLGLVTAVAGPWGMLIGGIFSSVGQILSFFGPKQDSLSTQIEKTIRQVEAEQKLQEVRAGYTTIIHYVQSLKNSSTTLSQSMAIELKDEAAARSLATSMEATTKVSDKLNPIDGAAIFNNWLAAEWLKDTKRQHEKLWPTVLLAFCQGYSELMIANVWLRVLTSTDGTLKRLDEASHENKSSPLKDPDKSRVEQAWIGLRSSIAAQVDALKLCDQTMSKTFNEIRPAIRNRGIFWHIGVDSNNLYVSTVFSSGNWTNLGQNLQQVAVTVPAEAISSSDPTLHVLGIGASDQSVCHGTIASPYNSLTMKNLTETDDDLKKVTDVWAMPGNPKDNPKGAEFVTAKYNWLGRFVLRPDKSFSKISAVPQDRPEFFDEVRVVQNPRFVPGDPNVRASTILQGIDYIAYGKDETGVFVWTSAQEKTRLTYPHGKSFGIAVDQCYLWMFDRDGLTCATHVSVMRLLKKELQKLAWMATTIGDLSARVAGPINKHLALRDLCSCDDGTLFAALSTWVLVNGNPVYDNPSFYTGVPRIKLGIDFEGWQFSVDWTKGPEGPSGTQVLKQPIFGWPLINSLSTNLGLKS
jgi:hypothetical protein